MKHVKDKYLNYLRYGGITKQEYLEIEDDVMEKNRSSLSVISACLVLMFTGLFLGSLFSEMMAPNRLMYGSVGGFFLLILLACRIMKGKGKVFILALWYAAMSIILAYAIILNTIIRNDISATTYCVIMMAAPLLIIDRPWHVFVYFVLVTAVFIPVDFHQKAYFLAFTDSVNALCCIFLGSTIHIQIMHTKLKEMIQKRHIEKERDTDKLTGCLTKAAFEKKIVEKLEYSEHCGTLLVMDLDHFKSINDNYGHVFGDMVLRTVGECIRQSFSEKTVAGRFGGDEFQIWIPGKAGKKELIPLLDNLLTHIRSIETPDDRVKMGASIGVVTCPENGDTYPTLFENADAALYTAKELGRNRYVFCPEVRVKDKIV